MYRPRIRDKNKRYIGANLELKRSFIKAIYKCNLINLELRLDGVNIF